MFENHKSNSNKIYHHHGSINILLIEHSVLLLICNDIYSIFLNIIILNFICESMIFTVSEIIYSFLFDEISKCFIKKIYFLLLCRINEIYFKILLMMFHQELITKLVFSSFILMIRYTWSFDWIMCENIYLTIFGDYPNMCNNI